MFRSVCGDLPADKLGYCQVHEHLYVHTPFLEKALPQSVISQYESSLAELGIYREAGGDSLVDAQPVGAGRQAGLLERMSRVSRVNIIAVTGYHLPRFYPSNHWIFEASEARLADLFYDELESGAYLDGMLDWPTEKSSIRAGLVKAAMDGQGLTAHTRRVLGAAGKAAVRQHAALMLHTEKGLFAEEAIDFLGHMGLDPERIIICHADRDLTDFDNHVRIAKTGAFLEYDTIARPQYHPAADEISHIMRMLDGGFASCMMLSLDVTASRMHSYGGQVGLDFLHRVFWPQLFQAGLCAEDYHQMAILNPRHAIAIGVN